MSDALVRVAFESALATWAAAQVPPIPVAFEDVTFEPPATRYARCWLLRTKAQSKDLGGQHRQREGIFQVDLCIPADGQGTAEATALAASLDAVFSPATPLDQAGMKVFVMAPMSPIKGPREGTHNVTYVSCPYRSDTI